jgi:hypothetical protein
LHARATGIVAEKIRAAANGERLASSELQRKRQQEQAG